MEPEKLLPEGEEGIEVTALPVLRSYAPTDKPAPKTPPPPSHFHLENKLASSQPIPPRPTPPAVTPPPIKPPVPTPPRPTPPPVKPPVPIPPRPIQPMYTPPAKPQPPVPPRPVQPAYTPPAKIVPPPPPPAPLPGTPSPKAQQWGVVISIVIIVLMVIIGAFYAWGQRIAQNQIPAATAQ